MHVCLTVSYTHNYGLHCSPCMLGLLLYMDCTVCRTGRLTELLSVTPLQLLEEGHSRSTAGAGWTCCRNQEGVAKAGVIFWKWLECTVVCLVASKMLGPL